MQQNVHIGNTANTFQDCLRGAPIANFHYILSVSVTLPSFQANVWNLTRRILWPSILRYQLAYMRRAAKLNNMSVEGWLNQVETINALLPNMEANTNQQINDELTEEVIMPKLLHYPQDEFELTYRSEDSIKRIIRSLTLIANKTKKAFDAARGEKKNQNNNKNGKKVNSKINVASTIMTMDGTTVLSGIKIEV